MIASRKLLLAAAILGCAIQGGRAAAAELNHRGVVAGAVVRLSDLFTGLEPGQDCDIGPAPAPGRTISIGAEQMAAIAGQFGVDIAPARVMRLTLTRSGRPLRDVTFEAPLREALIGAGAPGDVHVRLDPFVAPTVALDSHVEPSVEQLDYDARQGRFAARILIGTDGDVPTSLRLTGHVERDVVVTVVVRAMQGGETLAAADLRQQTVSQRPGQVQDGALQDPAGFIGLTLRRPLAAGEPIRAQDTIRLPLVRRGSAVRVSLTANGLMLGTTMQAMQSGAAGDDIRLVNPVSGAIVVAHLRPDGSAEAQPGSMPVGVARPGQIAQVSDVGSGYGAPVADLRGGAGL